MPCARSCATRQNPNAGLIHPTRSSHAPSSIFRIIRDPGVGALTSFNRLVRWLARPMRAAAALPFSCATVGAPTRVEVMPGRDMIQASAASAYSPPSSAATFLITSRMNKLRSADVLSPNEQAPSRRPGAAVSSRPHVPVRTPPGSGLRLRGAEVLRVAGAKRGQRHRYLGPQSGNNAPVVRPGLKSGPRRSGWSK